MKPAPAPSVMLAVRVQPGASREGVVGFLGEAVKIAVAAPADKGKANAALARFLARQFALPAAAVAVTAGAASRSKRVRIHGVTPEQLVRWRMSLAEKP
jgi:uncharacterized protein